MAKLKKQPTRYHPTESEIQAMRICNLNDLAYIIQPIKDSTKYKIIKYKISNMLIDVFTMKENDLVLEFDELEASKKIMELYTLHSKRFI